MKMTHEQIRKVVGANVRARRRLFFMSQSELGMMCGVSGARISAIEAGSTPVSIDAVADLADALETVESVLLVPGEFVEESDAELLRIKNSPVRRQYEKRKQAVPMGNEARGRDLPGSPRAR